MILSHGQLTLRSLQVFEAAVRCGSFTKAGEDLGITQSGVSRQVSELEATIGVALFSRSGSRVAVTPAGRRLASDLAAAFDSIWRSVNETAASDRVITLSMLPSVATRWFAPRLGEFLNQHPDVDLRISASRHLVDFELEGIDAAIRYSPSRPTNLHAIKLATETVQPVCTPDYAQQIELNAPEDLKRATLLQSDIPEGWTQWLAAAGCDLEFTQGPRLGDDAAILQAVMDNQGVALGRSLLVAESVRQGNLVTLFDVALKASYAYWLVWPTDKVTTDAFRSVKAWLEDEFKSASKDSDPLGIVSG